MTDVVILQRSDAVIKTESGEIPVIVSGAAGPASTVPGPAGDVAKAADRTALAATVGMVAGSTRYLAEAGREGIFVYSTADLSAQVTADPQQGIYVAPASAPAGASGAWVRRYDSEYQSSWFGAVGDGIADDTTEIQAAMNAVGVAGGGVLKGTPGKTYKITFLVCGHPDVTLDFTGAILTSAMTTSNALLTADTTVAARMKVIGGTWRLTGGAEAPWFFNIAAVDCEIVGTRMVKTPEAGGYMCYFRHLSDGLVFRDNLGEGSNGIFIEGSNSSFLNNRLIGRVAGGDDCFVVKGANDSCRNIRIVGNYIENMSNGLAAGSEIGYHPPTTPVVNTAGQIVFSNNTLKNCSSIAWLKPGAVAAYDYRGGIVEDVVISNNVLIDETGSKFERGVIISPSRGATVRRVFGRGNLVRARARASIASGLRSRGALDIYNIDYRTVIHFNSGGTYTIVAGNTITGATSGATGVVVAASIVLTAGTWAGGDAQGYFEISSKTGTFVAENINVGANLNVATIFGDQAAPSVSDIDVQVDYTDPWNGVANGVGGAPGHPVAHVAALENATTAYGTIANVVIDIRGNGSAQAGLLVNTGLGAIRIKELVLTQVNVTNPAGQAGAYLLSNVTMGSDAYWSVTPAAGSELSGAGTRVSRITSNTTAARLLGRGSASGAGFAEEIATDATFAVSGTTLKHAIHGAMVKKAADQTGADYSIGAEVAFDAEVYDNGGWHDNATNNTRLTVPAGVSYVEVGGGMTFANVTVGTAVGVVIRKNGATSYDGTTLHQQYAASTGPYVNVRSGPIPVVPGDYFEMVLFMQTDASVDVTAARTNFWIKAVG